MLFVQLPSQEDAPMYVCDVGSFLMFGVANRLGKPLPFSPRNRLISQPAHIEAFPWVCGAALMSLFHWASRSSLSLSPVARTSEWACFVKKLIVLTKPWAIEGGVLFCLLQTNALCLYKKMPYTHCNCVVQRPWPYGHVCCLRKEILLESTIWM